VLVDPGEHPLLTQSRRARPAFVAYPACAECARLLGQARAASLAGDESRAVDVRVLKERHDSREHGDGETGRQEREVEQGPARQVHEDDSSGY